MRRLVETVGFGDEDFTAHVWVPDEHGVATGGGNADHGGLAVGFLVGLFDHFCKPIQIVTLQ